MEAKKAPQYQLSSLIKKVTRNNLHKEVDSGHPAGKEAW